jgi:tRNA A37 methylthiotransferase MiaB
MLSNFVTNVKNFHKGTFQIAFLLAQHWIFFVGRSELDSPEVDGEVLISKEVPLKKGQFYQIEITGSDEFDLYGKAELE